MISAETTIIRNVIAFTVDARDRIIRDATIIVRKGRIDYVGPADDAPPLLPGETATFVEGGGHTLAIPGLVDAHNHSSLIRGVAENLELVDWLPVYDLEHRSITPADARASYKLGYLECLKNGTTTVQDMYRHMHEAADVAGEMGMRVMLAPYCADEEPYDFFESIESNEQLVRDVHGTFDGRVQVSMGIEDVFYSSERMYAYALECHEKYGVRIHTHGAEQFEEEQEVIARFGMSTAQLLESRGFLGDFVSMAHCVPFTRSDFDILASHGVSVCHCAVSAAKLGCGISPAHVMVDAGINVALGTDGPIDNNSMDLFQEMKFASLMQKALLKDARAFDHKTMLRMATINGARALGLDAEIGSLEVNKSADIVLIDTNRPNLRPIYWDDDDTNLLWAVVFAMQGNHVSTVMVQGRILLDNGVPTTVDEAAIIAEAQEQGERWMSRRKDAEKFLLPPIK